MLIAFTGNNIDFGQDLTRRTQLIELIAEDDEPEKRDLPDIEQIIEQNRSMLLSAALTILHKWQEAGSPKSKQKKGSFEQWSQTIGGILEFAGIEGFNSDTVKTDYDINAAFKDFLKAVHDMYGDDAWNIKKVLEMAIGTDELEEDAERLDLSTDYEPILLDFLSAKGDKKRSLGNLIRKNKDKYYKINDDVMVRLERVPGKNPAQYQLIGK